MKVFETNFENSSLIDRVNNIQGIIQGSGKFIKTDKGFVVNKGYISFDKKIKGQTSLSIITSFYLPNRNTDAYICTAGSVSAGSSGFVLYASNGSNLLLIVNYGSGIVFSPGTSLKKDAWNHIAFTWTGLTNGVYKVYVNSVLTTSGTITNSWTGDSVALRIIDSANTSDIKVKKVTIYDNIISQKEIIDSYIDFLNSKPTNKSIYFQPNLNILKPHELREDGLVAAYNCNPVNGKLINIAWDNPANNYNARQCQGSIVKCNTLSSGLKIPIKGFINITNFQPIQTAINNKKISIASTFISPNGGHAIIASFGASAGGGAIGIALLLESTGLRIEVFGNTTNRQAITLNNIINPNKQYTIVGIFDLTDFKLKVYLNALKIIDSSITDPGAISITDCNIGSINGSTWSDAPWTINDWKCYNRLLSDQEIKNYHNQFASKIALKEDFSQYPVGATKFGNWKVLSGIFTIKETNKYKYLEGTSSGGYALLPHLFRYGEFSFDVYPIGSPGISFISDNIPNNNKYMIYFYSNNNRIYLYQGGSVILANLSNYTPGIWYNIKIKVYVNGLFQVYLNGLLVGSVINTTVTSCKGFMLEPSGAPIRIKNIQIKQGVEI